MHAMHALKPFPPFHSIRFPIPISLKIDNNPSSLPKKRNQTFFLSLSFFIHPSRTKVDRSMRTYIHTSTCNTCMGKKERVPKNQRQQQRKRASTVSFQLDSIPIPVFVATGQKNYTSSLPHSIEIKNKNVMIMIMIREIT